RADRGNSDFDQRHNLAVFGRWSGPRLSSRSLLARVGSNWSVSAVSAIRSGFPYSVRVNSVDPLLNNRASLASATANPYTYEVTGSGQKLLNREAFVHPPAGELGNTARNAFRGPGLFSLDASLARSFPLGEHAVLVFRADVFNIANHANLNNPDSNID